MMELPEEQLSGSAITIMYLLEHFMPYDDIIGGEYKSGTGNRTETTIKEMIDCFTVLIPTLAESLKDTFVDLAKIKIRKFINVVKSWVTNKINQISVWYNNNFNVGYKYAGANSYIEVDTAKLRSYASRLSRINSRIVNLDKRLDLLYYKVVF